MLGVSPSYYADREQQLAQTTSRLLKKLDKSLCKGSSDTEVNQRRPNTREDGLIADLSEIRRESAERQAAEYVTRKAWTW